MRSAIARNAAAASGHPLQKRRMLENWFQPLLGLQDLNPAQEVRLILGDQLNAKHSWFNEKPGTEVIYVMMEMRQETDYAPHHLQKVVAFFGEMRLFAAERFAENHLVFYLSLDDPNNRQSLTDNLDWIMNEVGAKKVGEKACPFNALYWDFYERHREKLERNPRIEMAYRTWDRMDPDKQRALLDTAAINLN
jgi:deoxyribodipyrimidine photolyase-like uncharacterized protein